MSDLATNVLATVLLVTNITQTFSPSGMERYRAEKVIALVTVPGLTTNVVNVSTNLTRYIWCQVPLYPERRPLEIKDFPPLPPGVTNATTGITNR